MGQRLVAGSSVQGVGEHTDIHTHCTASGQSLSATCQPSSRGLPVANAAALCQGRDPGPGNLGQGESTGVGVEGGGVSTIGQDRWTRATVVGGVVGVCKCRLPNSRTC